MEVIFYHWHHSLSRFLTCSSLLTAPRECTAETGRAGWHVERKRRWRHSRWMINAKKIPFTVRESRWTMPVIYRIKIAFTHTLTKQSKQKTGTFRCHCLSSWFIFFVLSGMWFYKESKNQQLKTLGYTVYSTISIASLFHYTWQLCNQKLLYLILSVFGFC